MADESHPLTDNDNGYQSRKWRGMLLFWLVCTAGFAATIVVPAAAVEFATFGGLILAGYTAYLGANSYSKWTVRRGRGVVFGQDAAAEKVATAPADPAPPKD